MDRPPPPFARCLASFLARILRTFCRPAAASPLPREMGCGSLFGVVAGSSFSLLAGVPAALAWAVPLGGLAGSVIGLLLWLGADNLPETPIPPPGRRR